MLATLPQELLNKIIDHLHADTVTLKSSSLVCSFLRSPSQRHLFHTLPLSIADPTSSQRLHLILSANPVLSAFIRRVVLILCNHAHVDPLCDLLHGLQAEVREVELALLSSQRTQYSTWNDVHSALRAGVAAPAHPHELHPRLGRPFSGAPSTRMADIQNLHAATDISSSKRSHWCAPPQPVASCSPSASLSLPLSLPDLQSCTISWIDTPPADFHSFLATFSSLQELHIGLDASAARPTPPPSPPPPPPPPPHLHVLHIHLWIFGGQVPPPPHWPRHLLSTLPSQIAELGIRLDATLGRSITGEEWREMDERGGERGAESVGKEQLPMVWAQGMLVTSYGERRISV
ncbi:hypothetical protein LshimejAT787_3300060 [Lyophyllum shimeji]|uniref:F-box domain-containing protein n=1 Tax=Lyophyllum shimeji TaxID=47721 RepID=A0A9P3PZD7_LYOSH|nr:hypothetical protein LshimejAT787_3300060 [Lyophyllum shimeji]